MALNTGGKYETEIGTLQLQPAMAPRPLPQSWSSHSPTIAHYNGLSNGTTSAPPKLAVTLLPPHSTLQWHPAMVPSNGTTSTPRKLKLVVTLPPNHSTLQWQPTMAANNAPRPLHPVMAPRPLPQSWSSPVWHTTMTPCKGTTPSPHNASLQWHPAMAPRPLHPCNGTVVPRPIRQSGSSPSPLLEVRTPIAIAIWWKINILF